MNTFGQGPFPWSPRAKQRADERRGRDAQPPAQAGSAGRSPAQPAFATRAHEQQSRELASRAMHDRYR